MRDMKGTTSPENLLNEAGRDFKKIFTGKQSRNILGNLLG